MVRVYYTENGDMRSECGRCGEDVRGFHVCIEFLDGTELFCCTICNYELLLLPNTHIIKEIKEVGCVLTKPYVTKTCQGIMTRKGLCEDLDCANCKFIKDGWNFQEFIYGKITEEISHLEVEEYLKDFEVIHNHGGFRDHSVKRRHRTVEGNIDRKFQNYNDWLDKGKPIPDRWLGFDSREEDELREFSEEELKNLVRDVYPNVKEQLDIGKRSLENLKEPPAQCYRCGYKAISTYFERNFSRSSSVLECPICGSWISRSSRLRGKDVDPWNVKWGEIPDIDEVMDLILERRKVEW